MGNKGKMAPKQASIVGKDELIHQVATRAGLTLAQTSEAIDGFIEVVQDSLRAGSKVRLMGFGTWEVRPVAGRQVKAIRSGEVMRLPASQRVGFSVGAVLAKAATPPRQHQRQRYR